MASKPKWQGLSQPKVTKLTKQQYRKFRLVRKLHNETMGNHDLLCNDHKKYIAKQLPFAITFRTSRPKNHLIYNCNVQGQNMFIFELLGQPLIDIWRQYQGQEMKLWMERCGGFENSLIQLVKYCLRLYTNTGIYDILPECFRISEGKIHYCYDTWMRSTYEIVTQNKAEDLSIENYFLSNYQLSSVAQNKPITNIQITYNQYLYKLGLFIMSLALPEVQIRNYDCYLLGINNANIQQKIKLFKIKIVSKELNDLTTMFLAYQCHHIDQIWKFLDERSKFYRGISPLSRSSNSSSKNGMLNHSNSRAVCSKQNIYCYDSKQGKGQQKKTLYKPQLSINYSFLSTKRIKLKARSTNNQSANISEQTINLAECKQGKTKKSCTLKQRFTRISTNYYSKDLQQLLGLKQHIIQSTYESYIIKCLQDAKIKDDWIHKLYQNGSVYFGEFVGEKRQGKGIYFFDSEDFYYGDWGQNMMDGFGTYVFRSGECYYGQLLKGLKHGFGKFYYKDGRIYEGNWQENLKFGFGSVLFPNGTKFMGLFQKHGDTYGIFTWFQDNYLMEHQCNFANYNWQNNEFIYIQSEDEIIKTRLRRQSYSLEDELQTQTSECSQSMIEGLGGKQWRKEIYEGSKKNGLEDGDGKLRVGNKFQIKGKWKEGIMIEYISQ